MIKKFTSMLLSAVLCMGILLAAPANLCHADEIPTGGSQIEDPNGNGNENENGNGNQPDDPNKDGDKQPEEPPVSPCVGDGHKDNF